MLKKIALGLLITLGAMSFAQASDKTYAGAEKKEAVQSYPYSRYDWGLAQNGFGYCYEFTREGNVLNGGQPVPNYLCEQVRPSRVDWGTATNGYGYCFQWTPYGVPMNEGRSIDAYNCERLRPSYYNWARATNGYTYCFQFTPYGVAMNEGRSVPNYFCGGR